MIDYAALAGPDRARRALTCQDRRYDLMSTLRQPTDDEIRASLPAPMAVPPSQEDSKEEGDRPLDDCTLRPELRKVFEDGWKQNEAGYRHLASR